MVVPTTYIESRVLSYCKVSSLSVHRWDGVGYPSPAHTIHSRANQRQWRHSKAKVTSAAHMCGFVQLDRADSAFIVYDISSEWHDWALPRCILDSTYSNLIVYFSPGALPLDRIKCLRVWPVLQCSTYSSLSCWVTPSIQWIHASPSDSFADANAICKSRYLICCRLDDCRHNQSSSINH